MKKLFVLPAFLIVLPIYALCPIEGGETVCSLPEFRGQTTPIFQQVNPELNINTPQVKLQPLNRADPIEQMRGPNNNINYNSGCQFGMCLQNPNNTLQKQQ